MQDDHVEYERLQIQNIEVWKNLAPSVMSRSLAVILSPAAYFLSLIVPISVIEALLHATDWLATGTISDDIVRPPKGASLRELDAEAESVRNWAIAYGAAEGGLAGMVGLLSLPVDIPALVTLALRTIRRVGACYGYEGDDEAEKMFVMSVLSAAGANTVKEKAMSIATLQSLYITISKKTWKKIAEIGAENALSKEAFITFVRDVAEQIGIKLTKKRALVAIPAIGAIVGSSLNGWYLRDVGLAAQRSYQERWLRDNGRFIDL